MPEPFERDLHEMLARRTGVAPAALLRDVERIPATHIRPGRRLAVVGWASQFAAVAAGLVFVAIIGIFVAGRGLGAGGQRPSPTIAQFCSQVLRLVKIEQSGSDVVIVDAVTGDVAKLRFPQGFTTKIDNGSAVLLSAAGVVIGREGDVIRLGGGLDLGGTVFDVCTVNGISYP